MNTAQKPTEEYLQELKKHLANVEAETNTVKEEIAKVEAALLKPKWEMKPPVEKGEDYWFVNHIEDKLDAYKYTGELIDRNMVAYGNCFVLIGEADRYAQWLKADALLRAAIKEVNGEWNKPKKKQHFYLLRVSFPDLEFHAEQWRFSMSAPSCYCIKSPEAVEQVLNMVGEEQLKIWFQL